jgi:hypothetical protein
MLGNWMAQNFLKIRGIYCQFLFFIQAINIGFIILTVSKLLNFTCSFMTVYVYQCQILNFLSLYQYSFYIYIYIYIYFNVVFEIVVAVTFKVFFFLKKHQNNIIFLKKLFLTPTHDLKT